MCFCTLRKLTCCLLPKWAAAGEGARVQGNKSPGPPPGSTLHNPLSRRASPCPCWRVSSWLPWGSVPPRFPQPRACIQVQGGFGPSELTLSCQPAQLALSSPPPSSVLHICQDLVRGTSGDHNDKYQAFLNNERTGHLFLGGLTWINVIVPGGGNIPSRVS